MTPKALLQVEGINTFYDALHVVKDVSFTLHEGEIGCLLGPSGCGKTTLLRSIAGFEDVVSGRIRINGNVVSGDSFVPPEERNIGMIFQDYALFPHLSVADNIAFGVHRLPKHTQRERVDDLLALVGLTGERNRFPYELSGGQQQRVALARALAPEPGLLLMDEPFSNLDVALRESLSIEIKEILRARSITALIVTHNQNEAFAMADTVGVLSCGSMQQWASPYALYDQPANTAVAGFVGEGGLLAGTVTEGAAVQCALGTLHGVSPDYAPKTPVRVLVRPEHLSFAAESPTKAVIRTKTFRGSNMLYGVRLETGEELQALVPGAVEYREGAEVCLHVQMKHVTVFPADEPLMDEKCRIPVMPVAPIVSAAAVDSVA